MSQDFPTCIQCGALPESREQEHCRFCSAPLPWSEFDLRSRRVVVLVSAKSMDEAIKEVEQSDEYRRAVLALESPRYKRNPRRSRGHRKRARRRLRQRKNWAASHLGLNANETNQSWVAVALIGGFAFIQSLRWAGDGLFHFLGVAGIFSWVVIRYVNQSWETGRSLVPGRTPQRNFVMAAGILELGSTPARE